MSIIIIFLYPFINTYNLQIVASYWVKWMEQQTGVTSNLDIKMELWLVNSISSNRIGPFSFDAYAGYKETLIANNTYEGKQFYIGFSTFYQGW